MRQRRVPADVRIEPQRSTVARGTRNPVFNRFYRAVGDHLLHDVALIPVMAGDTMASLSWQGRLFGSPVGSQLLSGVVGAWAESWAFYVRVGDLRSGDAEDLRNAIVDPANPYAGPPLLTVCRDTIWKSYFMDEGDGSTHTSRMRISRTGWWDSARDSGDLPDVSGATDEWEAQWMRYEAMRRAKLTTKTFEEYLASVGVSVPPQLRQETEEYRIPELLHYAREYVYPQFSPSPAATGTAIWTWQWSLSEKVTRQRFCAEPGFICVFFAVRPKIYPLAIQDWATMPGTPDFTNGDAIFDPSDFLVDAGGWLPPEYDTDPHTSLETVEGSLFGDTDAPAAYVNDLRDYWLNGADFIQQDSLTGANTPWLLASPKLGTRPSSDLMTVAADFRVSASIKSRVHKDTTR